jgi:3-hydroxybutyrate dehydrogenase
MTSSMAWRDDWKAAYAVDVIYSAADVSKPAEVASLIAAAEAKFGSVDILVAFHRSTVI